jgi:hypothetical protein
MPLPIIALTGRVIASKAARKVAKKGAKKVIKKAKPIVKKAVKRAKPAVSRKAKQIKRSRPGRAVGKVKIKGQKKRMKVRRASTNFNRLR